VHDENDTPLSEEEQALARKGEALISAAVADARAPQSLRESIERDRERAAARARAPFWRRHRWGLAAAGTAAAALAAVAIALETGGGGSTDPSLASVYAAARLDPTETAPTPVGGTPPVLDAKVGALEFPDWRQKFGWKAVGQRTDKLNGRNTTTVFYRKGAKKIAYTIVSGKALDVPDDAGRARREGTLLRTFRNDSRPAVTWLREGHTCVLAGAGVPRPILLKLAAWKGKGAVRF
jgi:hypothetical protein